MNVIIITSKEGCGVRIDGNRIGCNGFIEMVVSCVGLFAGLAIGLSGLNQGRCAAAACDALASTGKGTANYFIVVGIAETVALFALVFSMLALG